MQEYSGREYICHWRWLETGVKVSAGSIGASAVDGYVHAQLRT